MRWGPLVWGTDATFHLIWSDSSLLHQADQIIHTWKLNLVNWQLKMWKDFWVVQRCSYKVPLTSAGPFGIPLQPEQSHLIMRWNFIPTWGTTANDPRGEWGAQICKWNLFQLIVMCFNTLNLQCFWYIYI
jgi:hypothetical protein